MTHRLASYVSHFALAAVAATVCACAPDDKQAHWSITYVGDEGGVGGDANTLSTQLPTPRDAFAFPETMYPVQNVASGMALSGLLDGNVVQHVYAGDAAQLWHLAPIAGTDSVTLQITSFGTCLGLAGSSPAAQVRLEAQPCMGRGSQAWKMVAQPQGGYQIVNELSGLCMVVRDDAVSDGATVVQAACQGTTSAVWSLALPKTFRFEYSTAMFRLEGSNVLMQVSADITVPRSPASTGCVSLTALQQAAAGNPNLLPTGSGGFGSVLSFGPACNSNAVNGGGWAAGGMYYGDPTVANPELKGYHAGPQLTADTNDVITLTLAPDGTGQRVTLLNQRTLSTVIFTRDLGGQTQQRLDFYTSAGQGGAFATPVILNNVTLVAKNPDTTLCEPFQLGATDVMSNVTLSADAKTCVIKQLRLSPRGL